MPKFGIALSRTVYAGFVIHANNEAEARTLGRERIREDISEGTIQWGYIGGFPNYNVIVDPLEEGANILGDILNPKQR
jgi:hypothetical protein